MSTISASTTTTTAYKVTADTTGTLVLQTGSTPTTAVTIDASQQVGVGVVPNAWGSYKAIDLQGGSTASGSTTSIEMWCNSFYNGTNSVYRVTAAASLYQLTGNAHNWYIAPSGTAGNTITFTQAMKLDNVALGSAYSSLSLNNTTGGGVVFQQSGTAKMSIFNAANDGYIDRNNAAGKLFFRNTANGTTDATIDASGNFMVGKTTSGFNIVGFEAGQNGSIFSVMSGSTNASSTNHVYSTGAGAYRFFVGLGGTVYATSTTISALSDQRLKENIRDLDVGLDKIMALKPRLYDWKEGKGADIKNARGFVAQEFEEVFPDLIDEWLDPTPEGEESYKSVRADLIPVLVKAIQEQQAIIETLTNRITALEAK